MASPATRQTVDLDPTTSSKRRCFKFQPTQPPITTFFASQNGNNSTDTPTGIPLSHYHYQAATSSPMPVLSEKVQSSLLSVGMRIRKSVSDGYKTNNSLKADGRLVDGGGGGIGNKGGGGGVIYGLRDNITIGAHPSTGGGGGGICQNIVVTEDGDSFSLPSSSQNSNGSSIVDEGKGKINGHKRSYEPDDEVEDDDEPNTTTTTYDGYYGNSDLGRIWCEPWQLRQRQQQIQMVSSDLSPSSSSTLYPPQTQTRHILRPNVDRRRRRFFPYGVQQTLPAEIAQDGMDLGGDFEEPLFLQKREEVDADYAVRCRNYEVGMYDA